MSACFNQLRAISNLIKKIVFALCEYRPDDSDLAKLNSNMASVWVKMVSSWLCIVIYAWSMLAPSLFPDRDFS